jgi:1-acyl-sn-glycerol-3-phosphate acyltransferase
VVAQALVLCTYYTFWMWLRYRGYRILEHRRARREFLEQIGSGRGPLLICANHLTLIDSLFIQWVMAPGWQLVWRPGLFAWNLPDSQNLAKRWWSRLAGYLGKCIPIVRKGPPEEVKRTLDNVVWMLERGQSVVIFPEGGRSRTGRVDVESVTYGVGRLLQDVPTARVLCVYLRGVGQKEYSNYPQAGERFFVRSRRIEPITSLQGLRGARDLAKQIIGTLSAMEAEYFDAASLDR